MLNDVEPKSMQTRHRLGVIGHQTQLRKSKVTQNLTAHAKEARIHRVAAASNTVKARQIGCIHVIAIRAPNAGETPGQVNARTLSPQINQHPFARAGNRSQAGADRLLTGCFRWAPTHTKDV